MTLPIWISTDQADRLKARLEAEGFGSVRIGAGSRGGDIVVTAEDRGREFNVVASDPMALEAVVGRFLRWRNRRG